MTAPADDDSSTTTPPLLVRMKKPLPRAIQLVMAIVWSGSKSSWTTKTIGDLEGYDRLRLVFWIRPVVLPSICIAGVAANTYFTLRDHYHVVVDDLISAAAGFSVLACPILLFVHMAVLLAAGGHLGLFARRTPLAASEAFDQGGFEMCLLAIWPTAGVSLLWYLSNQVWPLLVAWTYLLGLLVASTVALWICLLRTYGDGGGEGREMMNSSSCACGEAFIDGLAYLYSRLLYEFAVRFHAVSDADAGMQQIDSDVAVV